MIYECVLTMITLYRLKSGSTIVSRNSIPSVRYLIRVRVGEERSSNLIEYPTYRGLSARDPPPDKLVRPLTSSPSTLPTSSATRAATVVAATLLGCVHAITWFSDAQFASLRY